MNKALSKTMLETLKTAASRVPAYVLPLKPGIQGAAKISLLRTLRERGYIGPNEAPQITDAGREALLAAGEDWIK